MLKIRLQRVGRKNDPSFRVIVTESTQGPKSGKMIETLGFHNPRQKGLTHIVGERVLHWMSKGAQVSTTVHNLLVDQKMVSAKKRNALPRKRPIIKDVSPKDTTPASVETPAETVETAEIKTTS